MCSSEDQFLQQQLAIHNFQKKLVTMVTTVKMLWSACTVTDMECKISFRQAYIHHRFCFYL